MKKLWGIAILMGYDISSKISTTSTVHLVSWHKPFSSYLINLVYANGFLIQLGKSHTGEQKVQSCLPTREMF